MSVLPRLDAQSVHCCATSPPFFGLRDYGIEPSNWPAVRYAPMAGLPEVEIPGCDPDCEHEWGEIGPDHHPGQVEQTKWKNATAAGAGQTAGSGQFCQKCGGWRGQLGLEPTPEMYVGHLVTVFRLVRRVLRDDGTLWLNLGDSFNSSGGHTSLGGSSSARNGRSSLEAQAQMKGAKVAHLKTKDLIGIPWRVAFALQADGWWLRSEIVWAKGLSFCESYAGSVMPESVTDRPTRAHEQVFLLTKKSKYFFDHIAVREKTTGNAHSRGNGLHPRVAPAGSGIKQNESWSSATRHLVSMRNLRSVWAINPEPSPFAHYSAWPSRLVAPMIRAGTSERGVCPACMAPYERVVEKTTASPGQQPGYNRDSGARNDGDRAGHWVDASTKTTGWRPTCSCEAGEPVPATVLDPFAGTGTTADVARRLGRHAVMIDRSGDYVEMQREQTAQTELF